MFNTYWSVLGLPLSRIKGAVVDLIPFSVVELALQIGILLSLLCITLWLPWPRFIQAPFPTLPKSRLPKSRLHLALSRWQYPNRNRLKYWSLIGPLGLAVLGMGQGAFPFSFAPSAWRMPLNKVIAHDSLTLTRQDTLLAAHRDHLWREMTRDRYESLTEVEVVTTCSRLLDSVLHRLELPQGRSVHAIKPMGPLTTAMGLIYGGPAFHDPLFGELAMVRKRDMPSSRLWRLHGACHETAHAKGFLREVDAELLTQWALTLSDDIRYQLLGDMIYLAKSGKAFPYPPVIREDILAARAQRKEVEEKQPIISWLKRGAEKLHLRNSPKKYGDRAPHEKWDLHHPFYSTLTGLLTPDAKPIPTYALPIHAPRTSK